ncbi:MAG: hypothetical protein ACI8UO_001946 [Verrucomicrobiales bacterium]|jgi:hypothetical protein
MTRMKRFRFVLYPVLAVLLGFAAWRGWKAHRAREIPGTIASFGGKNLSIRPAERGAFYLQGDSVWGGEKIGGSGETIRSVGCTLCAIAMAATDLGQEIDPGALNEALKKNEGYTSRGWIIWSAVAPSLDDRVEAVYTKEVSHELIDTLLERGDVPIVKIFLPMGIPHWVAVVGKQGNEYLVKDPSYGPKTLVKLSARGPRIHAVRFIRKS